MSLDTMIGTTGTGPAPPPSGPAGTVGAGHPASDPAALFAALLLNGGQKMPDPPGKAVRPTAPSHTKASAHHPSRRPNPPPDAPNQPAAPGAALTTMLMALAAPPTTTKTNPDKPLPPAPPAVNVAGSTPAVTTTTKEAMDTVPAPVPSAPSAKADPPGSELLPQTSTQVSAQAVTASVATHTLPPTVATPVTSAAPPSAHDRPAPVAARSSVHVSTTSPTAVPLSAPASGPEAVLPSVVTGATVVAPSPVVSPSAMVAVPRVALTETAPPPASIPPPAQLETRAPTVMIQSALPAPATAPVSLTAQVVAMIQPALQNTPAPANNTSKPEAKADETPSTTGAVTGNAPASVGGAAQAEVIKPVAAKVPPMSTQTKPTTVLLNETPQVNASVSGPTVRKEDAEKPAEPAKVAETVLTAPPVTDFTASQTASAPHGAPTALTTTERDQVVRQISDGAQQIVRQPAPSGVRELNLQLHPHDWGQIKLSVRMTPTVGADGTIATSVIAHVVADNPVVKAALETHAAELRQTLHEAGLKLDRLSVTVQAPDAGSQSGSAGQEQRPFAQDSSAWTGQGAATPNTGAGGAGQSGSGFGAFSSGSGDGRGGQAYGRPAQPSAGWTEDAGGPEVRTPDNISVRPTRGRWDSRA